MPTYTLRNKKTGETWEVLCPWEEMKKKLNDLCRISSINVKLVEKLLFFLESQDLTESEFYCRFLPAVDLKFSQKCDKDSQLFPFSMNWTPFALAVL